FLGFCGHFFVAFQTGFLLGLTAFGVGTYPVEFVFKTASKFGIFFALNFQAFLFLFQVSGVVTFVWVQAAAVDFGDPFSNMIQEVPVVSDSDNCARVVGQVAFKPGDRFGVQVVCRLVQ